MHRGIDHDGAEEHGVDAVENAAVAGEDRAGVFDADRALEGDFLDAIADLADFDVCALKKQN